MGQRFLVTAKDPCGIAVGPVRNCGGTRAELRVLSYYNSFSLSSL
jgi:hypothetical protein